MASSIHACLILLLISICAHGAGFPTAHQESTEPSSAGYGNSSNKSEKSLSELIKTFSEDVGQNGEQAWRRLKSYGRRPLIKSLLNLRRSLPRHDPRYYSIAFVLCNLDYEYPINVKVLVSAMSDGTPPVNDNADSAASMLGRLIKRGDKRLLRFVFAAIPNADAALGEALADVISSELQADLKTFLIQLKTQPRTIRLKVYDSMSDASLTPLEVQKLKVQLEVLSHRRATSLVARELSAFGAFAK
jgi:hypothetical protein